MFRRLEQAGWEYSIGVRMIKQVKEIVQQIDETAWQTIADYPKDGGRRSPRPPTAAGG